MLNRRPARIIAGAIFIFFANACNSSAHFVTCGNAQLDLDEDCDGTSFAAGKTDCQALGFEGGTLRCNTDCQLDTTGCTGAPQDCADGPAPYGTHCDDGKFCTTDDRCDGLGACSVTSANACEDNLTCTDNECDEEQDTCSFKVRDGFCKIDELCYAENDTPTGNVCLRCVSGQDKGFWTPATDSQACDDDLIPCTDDRCDGQGTCLHPPLPGRCLIENQCYFDFDAGPSGECQICRSDIDPNWWTNLDEGTPCTSNELFCDGEEACNGEGSCSSPGPVCSNLCWEEFHLCCEQHASQMCNASRTAIYYFDSCDRPEELVQDCVGHSECVPGTPPVCQCTNQWSGIDCDTCSPPWTGADCDTCLPPWTGANCDTCLPPWTGVNCDTCSLYWARQMEGTGDDFGMSVAVDASGNVTTTGYFSGTVDFDPGPGVFNLTSAGSNDVFISRLDASGHFVWAVRFGGAGDDRGNYLTLDAAGNVYTTGFFTGAVDFDPGSGEFNLTSAGTGNIFITKLNPLGNLTWAKAITGTGNGYGTFIVLDADENIYTTGAIAGTFDFDPDAGVANITSASGSDIFVSKWDASGNYVWAKVMIGVNIDVGYSITVDASGNVITTGYFFGSVDFDPNTGTASLSSAGGTDIFISKLDSAGNYLWAKKIGAGISDGGLGLVQDAAGNLYVTGFFSGTADFNPGTGTFNLVSAGASDIFVLKLDPAGDFLWAKQMGGAGGDAGLGITLDTSENVYVIGYFNGTADFDPGMGVQNLVSAGGTDIFVAKFDSAGTFLWVRQIGGTGSDHASQKIVVDASGYIYFTGDFSGTTDFDPSAETFYLTSTGSVDTYIARLCP